MRAKVSWSIAIDNITMMPQHCRGVSSCFCGGCISRLGSTRSLFAGKVVFSKTLLACFSFPIVVPYPSSVDNHSATKLPEHRFSSDYSNLTGAIRKGKYLLVDKIFLLGLSRDDFVERPVLVEKQIRVPVTQDPGTFGSQHEELVSPIWDKERPAFVLTAVNEFSIWLNLLLASFVIFSGDVFVALWA